METIWNTSILRRKAKGTSLSETYITDKRICLRSLYSCMLLAIAERLHAQRKEHHPEGKIKIRMVSEDKLCNFYVGIRLRHL